MTRKGPFPARDCTKVFESWDGKYLFAQVLFFHPSMTVHFRRKKIIDPRKKKSDEKKIRIVKCSVLKISHEERRRLLGEAKRIFDKEDENRLYEHMCPSLPGMEPPSLKERRRLSEEEYRRAPRIPVR